MFVSVCREKTVTSINRQRTVLLSDFLDISLYTYFIFIKNALSTCKHVSYLLKEMHSVKYLVLASTK